MDRPNFYILLELDPSERNPSAIQAAIDQKQGEWSRDRIRPDIGREAQRNLDLLGNIKEVLSDENKREAEAREARTILKERERKAYQELDEIIGILASPGYLLEKQVKDLVKRFQGRLREEEVRGRIRVEIREEPGPARPAKKPVLRRQLMKEIVDRLELIDKERLHDLYDFLDRPRNSSLSVLQARARQLDTEVRNINRKTAEVTARQELAGHCLSIFKTAEDRAKYDNALERQGLEELKPLVEPVGSSLGQIPGEMMEQLLRKARERGIATEDARQYIADLAAKRKWLVQLPSSGRLPKLQRCGGCGVVNEEDATRCSQCGDPLKVECPQCKTINPSENRACSKCGFSVGDATLVRRLLRDAELALARQDLRHALQLIEEARVYWPDSAEAKSLLAAAKEQQQKLQEAAERLQAAVAERRFQEAKRLLGGSAALRADESEIARLKQRIDAALEEAAKHVARARQSERTGAVEDAIDAYSDALRECRDYQEARDGLAKWPPDPPSNLQATATAHAISLNWQESPSRGHVRYAVIRKPSSEPTAPTDGELAGETGSGSLTDSTAQAGELYYYAVYAQRGGAISAQAAVCGPILRVGEVETLRATGGEGRVSLDWEPPARATRIEVWRKEGATPSGPGDGTRLTSVSLNSATDTGLTNGVFYGYRVIAVFDGADGKPVPSAGATVTAVPTELPKPVEDLAVVRRKDEFEATWTAPPLGEVQLFSSKTKPPCRPGDVLSVEALESLGRQVPALGPGLARGKLEGDQVVHFTPATVSGLTAVVGQTVSTSRVDDVEELSVSVQDEMLTARWRWPSKVDTAVVALRTDQFPTGPRDGKATRQQCDRFKYERDGGYRTRIPAGERLYLSVYAAKRIGSDWQFASAVAADARKEVIVSHCRTLRYRLKSRGGFLGLGKSNEYELTITPDSQTTLPELLLVVKSGGIPLHPKNGTLVLRVRAGSRCSPEAPLSVRFKPGSLPRRWRARLFPADDKECDWLDLIDES